jgi:hypothetical protein
VEYLSFGGEGIDVYMLNEDGCKVVEIVVAWRAAACTICMK